jgi:hypothetical protein
MIVYYLAYFFDPENIPPKLRAVSELHSVTMQKALVIVVWSSSPT